jgi:hypothetical protein
VEYVAMDLAATENRQAATIPLAQFVSCLGVATRSPTLKLNDLSPA